MHAESSTVVEPEMHSIATSLSYKCSGLCTSAILIMDPDSAPFRSEFKNNSKFLVRYIYVGVAFPAIEVLLSTIQICFLADYVFKR